jgi:hypothetical protein
MLSHSAKEMTVSKRFARVRGQFDLTCVKAFLAIAVHAEDKVITDNR